MTKGSNQVLADVRESIRKMASAHDAVRKGIATHAEKQRVLHQEQRHAAEQQARILEGVKKQNEQVRAASQ